ncbi:MAG: hypothetical protein WAM14_26335 [Candidatus Nitrosopolaris sp.]
MFKHSDFAQFIDAEICIQRYEEVWPEKEKALEDIKTGKTEMVT